MQVLAQIVVGGFQTKSASFNEQDFFVDQIVKGPLCEVGHQHVGLWPAAWKLLLHHALSLPLHVRGVDIFSSNRAHYAGGRKGADTQRGRVWNEIPDHGNADDQENRAESVFLDGSPGLQKSNHFVGSSKGSMRKL